jgi:hypothetical protein
MKFNCNIDGCNRTGFKDERGLRRHITVIHGVDWRKPAPATNPVRAKAELANLDNNFMKTTFEFTEAMKHFAEARHTLLRTLEKLTEQIKG